MTDEVLIGLVRKNEALYDIYHRHYTDIHRRIKTWDKIGGIIKQPASVCRQRWKRLRDNYMRAMKLRAYKGSNANAKRPRYDDILSFMKPFLEPEIDRSTFLADVGVRDEHEEFTCSSDSSSSQATIDAPKRKIQKKPREMDDEVLIGQVRNNVALYDTKHRHYSDIRRRIKAWDKIGRVMEQPARVCRERWRRVRDNYMRAMKLRAYDSSYANGKKARHDDIFSFMKPFLESEINRSSFIADVGARDEQGEFLWPSDSSSSQATIAAPKRKRQKTTSTPPKCKLVVDFFENMGKIVATLPENIQMKVKREALNIVSAAEEKIGVAKDAGSMPEEWVEEVYKSETEHCI